MKKSKQSIALIVLIFILTVISFSLIIASFVSLASGDLVRISSNSMDNGESDAISKNDFMIIEDIENHNDVNPYDEAVESEYQKAGSYGDVIVFYPNNHKSLTPIVSRSVVYLEFNNTDWDPENAKFGGFDIPSSGLYNQKTKFEIRNYEWPKKNRDSSLVINLDEILKKFDIYQVVPHGGFITKGDMNPGCDQTSDFYSNDPPWVEPVDQDWIIGKYQNKLERDPLLLSCCCINTILPIIILIGIIVVAKNTSKQKERIKIDNRKNQRERDAMGRSRRMKL